MDLTTVLCNSYMGLHLRNQKHLFKSFLQNNCLENMIEYIY